MRPDKHKKSASKKISNIAREIHARRIVITDKHNIPIIHFPLSFFIVVTFAMPIVVGIALYIFLLSEDHIIVHKHK